VLRRDGNGLPAGQDPGKRACCTSAPQARRLLSIHRSEHFRKPGASAAAQEIELARSSEEEKQSQLRRLADFQQRNRAQCPEWLETLRQAVIDDGNVFEVLMGAVRYCSLVRSAMPCMRSGRLVCPAQHVVPEGHDPGNA